MNRKINRYPIIFVLLLIMVWLVGANYALKENKFYGATIEAFTVKGVFQQADVDKVKVTSWVLNIRSGAGEQHNIIKTANRDETFTVLGKINNWYVIKTDDDMVGCVNSRYVDSVGNKEQISKPTPRPQAKPEKQPGKNIVIKKSEPKPTLSKLEQQRLEMVGYINQSRKKNGKAALQLDDKLSEVAQAKSQDMVDKGYFSHTSPTYGSPFDMMSEFGISYGWAGENLCKNSSLKSSHEALMDSPAHRRNILQSNFNKVGIGVVKSGSLLYITEMFTD